MNAMINTLILVILDTVICEFKKLKSFQVSLLHLEEKKKDFRDFSHSHFPKAIWNASFVYMLLFILKTSLDGLLTFFKPLKCEPYMKKD